ncbi:hypothetical protein WJX74_007290 [Apatococcus lobatus]|uniref:SET domain-containing protein n=1 Tax=Apatococcus lobatus TaxID=904363 RepID=A0AAW1RQI4_9CHLO
MMLLCNREPHRASRCKVHSSASTGRQLSTRTLTATQSIAPGQVLVTAPSSVLLSVSDWPLHECLKTDHSHLTSDQALAVHLLHELAKGQASKWSIYIRQLPRSYSTACTFTPRQAMQLQVQHAIDRVVAAAKSANASWRQVKPTLSALGLPPKFCSKQAWQWAASTLSSRTMHDPRDPAGVLMPFGDLFNHTPPAAPTEPNFGPAAESGGDGFLDAEAGVYRLHARRGYAAGEEVYLTYGALCNLDLLEHYGFVLDDNPHDKAHLDPTWLEGCHPMPSQTACWLHPSGRPSWDLLSHLRQSFATLPKEKAHRYLAAEGICVGPDSEMAVCQCLLAACKTALKALPTTLHEDLAMLAELEQDLDNFQATPHCPEQAQRDEPQHDTPPGMPFNVTANAAAPHCSAKAYSQPPACSRQSTARCVAMCKPPQPGLALGPECGNPSTSADLAAVDALPTQSAECYRRLHSSSGASTAYAASMTTSEKPRPAFFPTVTSSEPVLQPQHMASASKAQRISLPRLQQERPRGAVILENLLLRSPSRPFPGSIELERPAALLLASSDPPALPKQAYGSDRLSTNQLSEQLDRTRQLDAKLAVATDSYAVETHDVTQCLSGLEMKSGDSENPRLPAAGRAEGLHAHQAAETLAHECSDAAHKQTRTAGPIKTLTANEQLALRWRVGYKRTLVRALELATKTLQAEQAASGSC